MIAEWTWTVSPAIGTTIYNTKRCFFRYFGVVWETMWNPKFEPRLPQTAVITTKKTPNCPKCLRRQHIEVTGTLQWQSATMGIPNKSLCPSCQPPTVSKRTNDWSKTVYQSRITRTCECSQIMETTSFLLRDCQYGGWSLSHSNCSVPKIGSHQNQALKIQQTLAFERPALVDAMEFLQTSQIPKPGTKQQLTTFAQTYPTPAMHGASIPSPATLHTWHKSWKNMRRLKPIHTNPSHETCIIQKLKHEFLMLLGTPLDCSSASWLHPRCQRKEMEGRNFMSRVMSFYAVTATGNQGWTPTSLRIPRLSPKTQRP